MDHIRELEKNITLYFREKVLDFMRMNPEMTLREAVDTWSDRYSAIYNSPSYICDFVNERLNPDFGISYGTLQETLRSEGVTFMGYIKSLLREGLLGDNNIFDNKDEDDEAQEEADEVKKELINDALGDKVNIEDMEDEELDGLLGKVAMMFGKVNEKVSYIRENLKDKNTDYVIKAISKGTGMSLEESKEALELLDV